MNNHSKYYYDDMVTIKYIQHPLYHLNIISLSFVYKMIYTSLMSSTFLKLMAIISNKFILVLV